MRLLIYGKDGVGKTELASQAPKPIFICAEQGTGNYDVKRFPEPKNFTDIEGMVDWLAEKDRGYETLVIDTLDWMENLHNKKCEAELGKELSKIGFNKGYEYALAKTKDFINSLSRIKHMNILALAHNKIKTFQDPAQGSGYDRYQLALRDDTANVWRQWADGVLFLDYETFKKTEDDRFAFGEGKRVMYTEERPSHQAKNRYSLPYRIPIERGTGWKSLEDAMKSGGLNPDNLVKEILELLPVITDEKKKKASEEYVKTVSKDPKALNEFKLKLVAIKNGGV